MMASIPHCYQFNGILFQEFKNIINNIYNQFCIPDKRKNDIKNSTYAQKANHYKKMEYTVEKEFAQQIRNRLRKYFSYYGY